jgi:chemotaxis protein MotA
MAFAAIFVSMIMEGGSPGSLFLVPPMMLVFGGTIGASMAGMLLKDSIGLPAAIKHALTAKVRPVDQSVRTLVELAEQARRNGLLALEESAKKVEDPFLRKGVELLVDGTDPDEIREIMDAEVSAKKNGDKAAAKVFADMGAYAPTIGIIGTVMGLVHVLEQLAEPEKLGHLIAAAFLATLWGVLSANVIWLPLSSKLKRITEIEVRQMELLIEGIMAIQAGSNPRMIEQKLMAYLPPAERPKQEKDAA